MRPARPSACGFADRRSLTARLCRVSGIEVDAVRDLSEIKIGELADLVRQLSTSAPPLTADILGAIVSHDAMTLLVARREGKVIGMLSLACFPTPTGVRAWIEDVVTTASARGSGVGSVLVRTALEVAARHGARTVDLTSRPGREAANRLYTRLGFEARPSNVYRYSLTSLT